ncbi:hypothetical protein [Roseomonas haemaphysalidis]|uniref:Uncharacterized protein n=1 Tax=Roseomonas haemaphysalidis TaxID=2768162 RepID=A0ABS3KQ61_9PROT|nr:hypothetical protein [Roseomonas haemaphysalidis]MBO1079613.1 hypothetical protein [Roseomonas haemaphysalidis]
MTDSSAVLPFPQMPQDRMRLAFRRLQDALEAQAAAVREFRAEVASLGKATAQLEGSLGAYGSALSGVSVELVHAGAAARSLEHTAARLEAAG